MHKLIPSAGQSLQMQEEQDALVEILEKAINASNFAPKTLINDLRNVWNGRVPVAG